jgi:hypothetical protein
MAAIIRLKRGPEANLGPVTLQTGEPAFTTDTEKLFIGNGSLKIEVGNRSIGPITTLVRANSAYWSDVFLPVQQDYRRMISYASSFLGLQDVNFKNVMDGLNRTKWSQLAVNPSSSLTLQLCSVQINGKNISMTQHMTSIIVNGSNYYTRNDGFGPGPANYIDFTNAILSKFGQFTNFIPSSLPTNPTGILANICILDNFKITFEERYTSYPSVLGNPPAPYYYSFNTLGNWTLRDGIGDAIRRTEIQSGGFGFFRII